jgi:predicted secreted Zn-dependent protease
MPGVSHRQRKTIAGLALAAASFTAGSIFGPRDSALLTSKQGAEVGSLHQNPELPKSNQGVEVPSLHQEPELLTSKQDYEIAIERLKIRAARIKFYDVEATSLDELHKQMLERGPKDEDGIIRKAYTYCYITWDCWPKNLAPNDPIPHTNGEPNCSVGGYTDVTLPRHTKIEALSKEDQKEWYRFLARITEHESIHVGYGVDARNALWNTLKEYNTKNQDVLTPNNLDELANAQVSVMRRNHIHLDRATFSGGWQGAEFIIPAKKN